FDGFGDEYYNSAEVSNGVLVGTVTNVEDGQEVSITITDVDGKSESYTAIVSGGEWTLVSQDYSGFAEGTLTVEASVTDVAGNTATSSDTIVKDTLADISVDFDGFGDEYYNSAEVSNGALVGTVTNVEDGQEVSITITDVDGKSENYTATVTGGEWTLTGQDYSAFAEGTLTVEASVTDIAGNTWTLTGQDYSAFAEGELTVEASVTDIAGNTATSSDTIVKDTLADISVDFDGFGDEYYNLAEITNGALVGTVTNVEDGQTITITLTDSLNVSQVYTTTVVGGNWTLTGQDYSGFAEGILTVEASVTDVAGNTVTSSDIIVKDTLASITAKFDDADNILNTEEVQSVRLQGVVQNVENGQPITVTVSDSNNQSITLQTVVVAGAWSIDDVDLSAFADGNITVEAVTVDIAGNETTGTDSTGQIDTVPPVIDIDTLSGFNILDFRSGDLTTMQGTTDVSEGLPVYIEINDGTQTLTFEGVVDASGGWLVENIDVSSLDPSTEWIIDARVVNSIGNEVSDDMPSIILPDSVSFSESTVGIFGDQTQVADINIQFADEFAFSANQVSAEGVTSQGQSIAIELESDGQVIKATRTDGTLVFEAKIVGGTVEITFYQAVDQQAGEELLQTAIIIEGLQIDDDGTTELVLGELPITILDSEPLLFGESYSMVEGETSSGNVLNNDIDLDTALTISSVEVGGVSQDISGATPAVFNTGDGVLTVFANGQWTFEANRNLDHNQDHTVIFNYVAADSSGDFGSATATIDIMDGAAGQILDDSKTVTEVDVTSGSQTINAQFTVLGGSDNPDPDSIQFSSETVAQLEALGITSGGDATVLTYTLSADGRTITAKQGDDDVFSFSMTTTVNGNNVLADIVLVIERPLDHVLTSDLLTIPLNIIGTDTDGTALENGQISWVIEDGNDPSLILDSNSSVNESELSNDPIGEVSSTGTFSIGIGSDYLDSVFFDLADQPQLFSGGEQIYCTVSEDGTLLTGYAGPVAGGDVAFTVSFAAPVSDDVDSSVDYVFTLYKGLDQANGTDTIPFTVTARDSDNDQTKLDLIVSITDGGEPTIGSGTVELSETPIADTTPDGVKQSAVVNLDITASHDPIVYLGIDVTNGQAVLDSDGEAVTHNGEALSWRDNGDGSFDAILSNGDVIMQIRLPSDYFLEANASGTVAVEIDLYRSIDHATGLKDTELNIPTTVVVIDSDGSRSTQKSDIKIYDGKDPTFSIVGSISVDEDGLIGDNEQTGTEEPSPSIAIIQGSDDIASVSVNTDAFDALAYTSGGQAISLQAVNADGWYYAQDTSGNDIFRIRFNNDGTTEFNLYAPLDHATGDGENNLAVNFELVVTDADGDSSDPAIYVVNVTDAVPTSRSGSIEMVEGDNLSGQFLTEGFAGADGAVIVSFDYRGDTYTFTDAITSIEIDLINDFDNSVYGQFTLNSDGSYQLTTNANVSTDPTDPRLIDDIDYLVRDADGDEVTSTAELVLDDNEGFIRYEDSETTEDNDAIIVVSVSTGDVDQSETVTAISTEPDGDSGEFPMALKVTLDPVVDQTDGVVVSSVGIEDSYITLSLNISVNQDVDSSETLTGYIIDSLPDDLTLYFDGVEITVDAAGLDLGGLASSEGVTLQELLDSDRLTVLATEDLSGTFSIPITYEVTDTSPTGATDVKDISGAISVTVDARVESDTRLESSGQLYTSDDGSPVNVSDAVTFVDADMDGSEYLDYILIDVPDGYSLIIDHPNGAAQDISGNWIISANGLTSDSIQELAQEILSGMTISSPSDTPVLDIVVRARVIDGEDSKYIDTSFQIQITGHDGGGGTCDPVGPPSLIQPDGDIKTPEGEDIDLTGLLNTNVGSDPDNEISFYIPADSLPDGVEISGDGVIAEYDASGEVVGYSITADGLSKLTLTGLDEDFAGCIDFTIKTIETSPCNGETVTTDQTISIQVLPVVDDITVATDSTTIQEDITTDLNLELVLGDSVEDGQLITGEGNSATGKETINSLTITVSNGGTLSESPTDTGLLVDNGNGTWTVTDPSRLSDVLVTPPEHYSGEITLTVTANITDEADCVVETDTQDKTTVVTITVEPVADAANLVTEDIVGDEDNYISLSSLSAELIDQDGSENMSLALKGVPEGAVVAIKVGDSYELVPNNGVDGGTFDGNPTYEWQLDPSQLANLVILPPRDFSGDMNLVLEAITQEIGTTDIRYTESEFTVGVNPIGDKVEFFDLPEQLTGSEDDGIVIPLDANSFETNSDEFLAITVTVNSTSDPSGLVGLDRIRIGSETSSFTNVGGIIQATILVKASSVDELEFFAGDAFGNLDITITGRTVDQNTVLGELVVDTGDPSSQDMTLIITPEPDAPLLSVEYSSIVAEASGTIPLNLDLSLVNPADSEAGFITIYDIPAGLTFSHGSMVDGQYVVDLADVPNLAITGGYDGVEPFELTIEPSAEIGNNQAVGLPQTVSVEFVAEGNSTITATDDNDLLIGGTGSDNFVFASSGLGSVEAPSYDVVQDFDASPDTDAIDLSGILGSLGLNTGLGATQYLDLEESGEGVTISIKPNGDEDVQQNILLADVTYDDLYQGDSSSALEAQILQKMIEDNNLTL
uniref:T1SS-143 repeat domain-containing protein n=1 Tax=Vibrio cyclitrophicus TaxID=47951 RepID=UPI00148DC071